MKILTDKSFDEAMKLCQDNDDYKVLIVVKDMTGSASLLNYLYQSIKRYRISYNRSFAEFSNGSVIDIVTVTHNTRGLRANLVLCDPDIYNDNEEIKYILSAMEMNNSAFKLERKENQQ